MKSTQEYAIKTIVPNEVYTDREEFLTSYYDAAILAKTRRSMSSLLLGMRRMGKTEIFKRVVNRLFFEQDHLDPNAAIPVFFHFSDETITRDSFALEYVENFIRWYVAFKLRNVEILSKPEKTEVLFKLIDRHITMTRGFSVAIDLLEGIIDKGVINPSKKAIHLPRTVSDLDDSTIIMFIDEFQNSRMPQYDFSVTGFYQEACESPTCPHFITGSAMTILAMELVGTGALYGRFEFERIESMTPYFATQLTHKAKKYYQADISNIMAPFIAERCGGNPFYINAVVKRSAKIRKPIHDMDALNEVLAVDITSGFIWGELHDQVNRWIHRLNNFNITKWILYLSALDENNDLKKDIIDVAKIQQALKDYEGVDIEIEQIQDILLKQLVICCIKKGQILMMMKKEEAKKFALKWLPAWTGNKPEELAEYYSDDCLYMDAGIPDGAKGKHELTEYFRKLLAQNPDWTWTQIEAIPMESGFLNKWLAKIPVGKKIIECIGVCFVQFDEQGKIRRNEVYFDRTELLSEIYKLKKVHNTHT